MIDVDGYCNNGNYAAADNHFPFGEVIFIYLFTHF